MRKLYSVTIMMIAISGVPALPATIAQAHATPAVTISNPAPLAPAPPPPPPPGPQIIRGPGSVTIVPAAPADPPQVQDWLPMIPGGGPPG